MFVKSFWAGLSVRGGGAYMRCTKKFRVKRIQHSQSASLNNESNVLFDNNLNNNYL